MTPVWVPLLVAAVGLLGVLLTQWLAGRRAIEDRRADERREERHTAAETARQQREWERGQRRDAHANFLAEQWRAEHTMTMYNQVGSGDEPSPDWTEPMARQLDVVRIFGSPEAYAAGQALQTLTAEMDTATWGVGRYLDLDAAKKTYIAAVQHDLGLGGVH